MGDDGREKGSHVSNAFAHWGHVVALAHCPFQSPLLMHPNRRQLNVTLVSWDGRIHLHGGHATHAHLQYGCSRQRVSG